MDKFSPLEPTRLYANSSTTATSTRTTPRFLSRSAALKLPPPPTTPLVGRLPTDLHLLVLHYLPITDIPAYARLSRATASLTRDEKLWETRWLALGIDTYSLHDVLDRLDAQAKGTAAHKRTGNPPTIPVEEDDFGDFASVNVAQLEDMGDF